MNIKEKQEMLKTYNELVDQMCKLHENGSPAVETSSAEGKVSLMEKLLKKFKIKIK